MCNGRRSLRGNPYALHRSPRHSFSCLFSSFLTQTLLQGSSAPLPEYKTSALKKSRWVLSHYGVFKTCWDWLILIATFYVAIVVPYNASFVNTDKPSMVSDVVVESLFIVGEYSAILFIVPCYRVDVFHVITVALWNILWSVPCEFSYTQCAQTVATYQR